jgi:hypothetical protein
VTPEEALLFLPLEDQELNEVYEDRLFDMKQFFLRQVPVSRLYASKVEKMKRLQEAYLALGGKDFTDHGSEGEMKLQIAPTLLESAKVYQGNLSALKAQVMRATSFPQLIKVSERLLKNMRYYAEAFAWKNQETESVRVSQAPDEMELLAELNRLDNQGIQHLARLAELNPDNCVRKEANRLSLWLKMEMDERAI